MTEAAFQDRVVKHAKADGWLVYHTHDSRRCEAGFPDLVLVRGDSVLFVELKANNGTLSEPQLRWTTALLRAGAAWECWTPATADLAEVVLGLAPGALTAPDSAAEQAPERATFTQEPPRATTGPDTSDLQPLAAQRAAQALRREAAMKAAARAR